MRKIAQPDRGWCEELKISSIENLADPENLRSSTSHLVPCQHHSPGTAFRDKDQRVLVKDDEVPIGDEFTGRIMPGRHDLMVPSGD